MTLSALALAIALITQPASPASVNALLQNARRQVQSGDAAAALESLRQARTLAPNSEEVLSAFARVALANRQLVPALDALDALTRICSTVAEYHYLFGVALMEAGDMLAAAESLREADRLDPDRALTLIALGLAENNRKEYDAAKRALARALNIEADNVDALAALAESEAGTGELTAAEGLARRALARSDTHATANLVIGIIMMQRERYADARDALRKAVAAQPNSPAAHYQLSLAYARLGDDADARVHVDLYRQKLREAEERLKVLRGAAADRKPR